MQFTYTGKDTDGAEVTEIVEAADRYAVYDIARQAGHTVDSIKEKKRFSLGKIFKAETIEYYTSRIKTDDMVLMTRNLGAMLVAGLPVSRALSVIERQSSNARLRRVIADVRERIQKGEQFNEAIAHHESIFDDLYVAMVRAGEESGSLADTLKTLSIQMERSSSLKKKIKGAMIYPAIVLTIMAIIGVLMMIYVMPSITGTFKKLEVDLPTMTKVLIAISDFMVAHTIVVLLGMVCGVVAFLYSLRTRIGKLIFHWLIIRLPVIGTMVKETNAARTSRTLSSLLSSGVDVIRALNITEDVVQNVYYKPIIAEAAKRVEKGTALSEVFVAHENLYPVFVGEMIMVGEETGQISTMLEQLATFYENEVEQKTKDLSTIIEPLLMVVIGGTVGFFALAMIAPIYSLSDSIG
ncbi:type II secretion system F family protein [Candidatus Kaiserbacteria bacterium]|nr:type II secretion system F family protein [Candidatus Kaiserbacteria bacterium]MCB9811451.1 type II secretion system F family protein [Candidatus Nomurabacteria bacterium]